MATGSLKSLRQKRNKAPIEATENKTDSERSTWSVSPKACIHRLRRHGYKGGHKGSTSRKCFSSSDKERASPKRKRKGSVFMPVRSG